jgi:hypothetical protein
MQSCRFIWTRKSLCITAFSLTTLVLLAHPAAWARDFYVDNTVSANGNGTIGAPFRTIQEGLSRLTAGDTLWLRGNAQGRVYKETLSLSTSGTAAQPITVRVYPNEKAVLTGTSGTRIMINKDYWTFDGLIIDQANLPARTINIAAKHIVIKNAEIRNGQRDGISIGNAAFVTIQDSYIHNFMRIENGQRVDAHCIVLNTGASQTTTDIKIYRNRIERCSGDGIQIYGVTGQPISTYAKNIEIIDNTFTDGTTEPGLTENALDFKAGDTVVVRGNTMTGYQNNKTIVVQKGCRNIMVEYNILSHGLSGIEMRQEGGINFLQENPRVLGNIVHHMSTYALKFDGVVNATVVHNTLAYVGAEPFRFESTLGSSTPSVKGGLIKNNLVYMASASPRLKAPLANVDVGYNGWFQASAGDFSRSTDTKGPDPFFVNPAIDDYHLRLGSTAIDVGTPVGLVFFGLAPDLGALERTASTAIIPPPAAVGWQVSQ